MFQTSSIPLGEVYEKWDDIEFKDKEIVWLPMVIIEKDDNDKIINIQNDSITIVASMYWFLRPLSWDT
ncbi:hypothetical protein H5410_062512 [Solanum commersonii]|uniref:Uncharacterized protein n=1 Tax=Solanum commersonii TaxID=4109 RepID=A0A9J5WB11_SOLCO|nr:hypothetical protein H5410_062512 [Solanum commersonii]